MYKRFRNTCLLLLALVGLCSLTHAVEDERLWLPTSYERLYLDLKKAATKTEALERCDKVLRGGMDFQASQKNHPIFRIHCRQPNGRTYNELVDGLSFDTLTTIVTVEVPLTQEELEAQQLDEERRKQQLLDDQKQQFLDSCKKQLTAKTIMFEQITMVDDMPEPRSFSMETAEFVLDFDSEDMYGKALRYRAYCRVELEAEAQIKIRTRHD